MTLDQLTAFRTVVRTGGFGRAAAQLNLTQPAVSKQVRALEDELGQRVLERGRHVRSTPAGEVLLKYADRICEMLANARQELADAAEHQRGDLAIGATQTIAGYLLPRVIASYRRRFPDVKLRLETRWPLDILDALVAGNVDVGLVIIVASMAARYPQLVFEPIGSSDLLFVSAEDHGKVRTLEDLDGVPWVLSHDGCQYRAYLQRAFAERNLSMNIAVEVTGMDVLRRLLLLGLGVSLVPRALVKHDLDSGALRAFRIRGITPRSQSCIVYRRDKYQSQVLRAFLDLVHAAVPKKRQGGDFWHMVVSGGE